MQTVHSSSGGFAVELTPEIKRAIAIVNGFTALNFGACEPDLTNVKQVKEASRRILEHAFGPLKPDGLPQSGIGREIANAVLANEAKIRNAISEQVLTGKTEPADYYEVLCEVLTDSGLSTLPAMLSPATARILLARAPAAIFAAKARSSCSLCAACSLCSACAVCTACGGCILSVVIGAGATAVVLSVAAVGSIAGYFFE